MLVHAVVDIKMRDRQGVPENGSASSNVTPCFFSLARALRGSHSKITTRDSMHGARRVGSDSQARRYNVLPRFGLCCASRSRIHR